VLTPPTPLIHNPPVRPVVPVAHPVAAYGLGLHGLGYGLPHGIVKRDAAIIDGHTKILTPPTPLIHNPPTPRVAVVAPAPVVAHPAAYGLGLHGLGYGLPHGIVKRDAAIIDGHTKILTPPTPLIHNPPTPRVAVVAHAPVVAPHAAYGLGLHGLGYGKREADPQLLGLHAPLVGFPTAHAVANAPVVKSVVEAPAEVTHEVTEHAVPVAVGYHGLGYGLGLHGYGYGR